MKVWMRGRWASLTASQAASMSALWVRARPQITGPSTLREISSHGLEVAGRGDREAGLDHVDAERGRAAGRSPPSRRCSARCRATARRRAGWCRRCGRGLRQMRWSPSDLPPSRCLRMILCLAAIAPPSAIPPEGGGEGEAPGCRSDGSFGVPSLAYAPRASHKPRQRHQLARALRDGDRGRGDRQRLLGDQRRPARRWRRTSTPTSTRSSGWSTPTP